jgi:thioredoxin 1
MKQSSEIQMGNEINFTTLNEDNFQSEVMENSELVLVVFKAPWLGSYDIMVPILNEINEEFKGRIKFGAVNIESNRGLSQKYGIVNLPAFLFFKNGQLVEHIFGVAPKNVFVKKIIHHL